MAKEQVINVTVKTVPHPNPERAINLMANLILKNFSKELEEARSNG